MVDAVLATAVLTGLVLNAALGWWWADPAAGYVLVFYAARGARDIVRDHHLAAGPGEPLNQDTRRTPDPAWPHRGSCGAPGRTTAASHLIPQENLRAPDRCPCGAPDHGGRLGSQ